MKAKSYRDKVTQTCKKCQTDVLAIRINGFYAGSRDRIFLWECPMCETIWKKPLPLVRPIPSMNEAFE
mgnify:FL=1